MRAAVMLEAAAGDRITGDSPPAADEGPAGSRPPCAATKATRDADRLPGPVFIAEPAPGRRGHRRRTARRVSPMRDAGGAARARDRAAAPGRVGCDSSASLGMGKLLAPVESKCGRGGTEGHFVQLAGPSEFPDRSGTIGVGDALRSHGCGKPILACLEATEIWSASERAWTYLPLRTCRPFTTDAGWLDAVPSALRSSSLVIPGR
jgi:hypothetical protein